MKNQTRIAILVCLGMLFATNNSANAQVKIGADSTVLPRSILELEDTAKAFMPTRLTTTQRNNVTNWNAGHTIYNVTDSCLQTYDGTLWKCAEEITTTVVVKDTATMGGGIQKSALQLCGCGDIADIAGSGTSTSVGSGASLNSLMQSYCGIKLEAQNASNRSFLLPDAQYYNKKAYCLLVDVSNVTGNNKTQRRVFLNASVSNQIAFGGWRNNAKSLESERTSSLPLIDEEYSGTLIVRIVANGNIWHVTMQ